MEKIVMLKGPERVRRRVTVVYGDDGLEGACRALEEIWGILKDGGGDTLFLCADGDKLEMHSNGKGLCLENWEELFSLSAGMDTDRKKTLWSPYTPSGTAPLRKYDSVPYDDFSLYAFSCVCDFLEVTAFRGGKRYDLRFEKGVNVGGLREAPTDSPDGTSCKFRLDDTVFTDTDLPVDFLYDLAQNTAMLCPGVVVELDRDGEYDTFCYKKGLAGRMKEMRPGVPVYTKTLKARGKERYNARTYGASVKIALTFYEDLGFVKAFHNGREIMGGPHVEALKKTVKKYLRARVGPHVAARLERHLCLFVQTTATRYATRWGNGTRTTVENRMIADMAEDIFQNDFCRFCNNRQALLEHLNKKKD